ncbi:MAG: hypothetical protein ACFFB3_16775, partial [Candidatus Hodarchaeota archaeon]
PSLILHAETNATVVFPGDIIEITYAITNIGNAPAYDIELWGFDNESDSAGEWNFINVTQQDFNYSFWDPSSNRAFFNFDQIDAGETVEHKVYLNATIPGEAFNASFVSTSYIYYYATPMTNPDDWVEDDDFLNLGNDLGFLYNHTDPGPIFNVSLSAPTSIIRIGENFTLHADIVNIGSKTAYNITWQGSPAIPSNITNTGGIIKSLAPGESTDVLITYFIDAATPYVTRSTTEDSAPTRQLGGGSTVDLIPFGRYDEYFATDEGIGINHYGGWYIDSYTDNSTIYTTNFYANEIKLDILPASDQSFDPFLTVDVEYSRETVQSDEQVTVLVTVSNAGNSTAENIFVNSEFSDAEFEFYSGAGSVFGGQGTGTPRQLEYDWGNLAPGDSFSFSYRLKALKSTSIYTNTYASVDWDAFTGGLTRIFYPRTYDWEAPALTGPEDLEIVKNEFTAITASLNWSVSDEHAGTYRLLQANSSMAIVSTNASNLAAANLTFIEIGSGRWTNASWEVSHSLAGLGDGFYLFTIEAIDCCGNRANHSVAVSIRTILTPEEEDGGGLFEDINDYISENSAFLMIIGALTIIVIAEGVIIYFMRRD